jgi:RNA-directed DNA polymerase
MVANAALIADDAVMGIPHRADAERFLQDWRERLWKFGLESHPDKTRLTEFGRFPPASRKQRGKGQPETFNFLGVASVDKPERTANKFRVLRKTIRKSLPAN